MKNRLRVLRAEREWSQADLAARLHVSRQTINAIETGKYDPSLPLAFDIAPSSTSPSKGFSNLLPTNPITRHRPNRSRVTPAPIPKTEVKPRRADCTVRESVWESRACPERSRRGVADINNGHQEKSWWPFPFAPKDKSIAVFTNQHGFFL